MTRVSIRTSVLELMQTLCCDRKPPSFGQLEAVLYKLWQQRLVPDAALSTPEKLQKLAELKTVAELDLKTDICYREAFVGSNQELALYMIAKFSA